MPLLAKDSGGGDWELAPAGTHLAKCVQVVDKGTHYEEKWDKHTHKIMIGWELSGVEDSQGRPSLVFGHYTLTLSEMGNLRPILESWRGKPFTSEELEGFDVFTVLGAPCMISVIHNDSTDGKQTFANVNAVMALPKGSPQPEAITPKFTFDITDPDMEVFDKFGDRLKATITSASEWKDNAAATQPGGWSPPVDDGTPMDHSDIPF